MSVLNLKFSDKRPSFQPVRPAKGAGRHIYTPVDVYLYLLCKIKCEIKIASVKHKQDFCFSRLTFMLKLYFCIVALVRHPAVINIPRSFPT